MQEPLLVGAEESLHKAQLPHFRGSIVPMQIPESAQPCFFVHPLLYYRHCFRLTSQSDRVERVLVMSERFVVYLCAADGRATWSFHPTTVRSVHVMPTKDTALFTFTEHVTDLLLLFDEKWSTGRENPAVATLAYFLFLLKRENHSIVVTEESTYEKLALSNLIKKRRTQVGVEGFVTRLVDGVAGYYRTLLQQLEAARRQLAREEDKKTRQALAVAMPTAVSAVRQRRRSGSAMLRNVPLRLISFVDAARDVEEAHAAGRRRGLVLSEDRSMLPAVLLNPLRLLAASFDRSVVAAGHPETMTLHRLRVVDHGALPLLSQLLEPFQLIVFFRRCVTVTVTTPCENLGGEQTEARAREGLGRQLRMQPQTGPAADRKSVTVSSQGDLVVDHTGRVFLVRYRRRRDDDEGNSNVGGTKEPPAPQQRQSQRVVEVSPDEELDVTTWDPVLFLPLVVDVRVKLECDDAVEQVSRASSPPFVPLSSVTVNRLAVGTVDVGMHVPYRSEKRQRVPNDPTNFRLHVDDETSEADGGEKVSPTPLNETGVGGSSVGDAQCRSSRPSTGCWGSRALHELFLANDPPTRFYEEDSLRPPPSLSQLRLEEPQGQQYSSRTSTVRGGAAEDRIGVGSNLQRSVRAYEWRHWHESEVQAMREHRDAWHRRISAKTFGTSFAEVRTTISFDAVSASHMSAADQPVTSMEMFVRLVDVFSRWKRDEGAFWRNEEEGNGHGIGDDKRREIDRDSSIAKSAPPPTATTSTTTTAPPVSAASRGAGSAVTGTGWPAAVAPTLFSRKEVREAERARRRQCANVPNENIDSDGFRSAAIEPDDGSGIGGGGVQRFQNANSQHSQLQALENFLDARDTLETFTSEYGEPWADAEARIPGERRAVGTAEQAPGLALSNRAAADPRWSTQDSHGKLRGRPWLPAATRDALRQVIQTVCDLRRASTNRSARPLAGADDDVDLMSWEWETV